MHMIFNACGLLPLALSMYYYAKNCGSTLHDMGNQTRIECRRGWGGRSQALKIIYCNLSQNIHKEANYPNNNNALLLGHELYLVIALLNKNLWHDVYILFGQIDLR